MNVYTKAEFIALYRTFESEGNKLLGQVRDLVKTKQCFESTETKRIWRLKDFGIPRNPTAFAEMNVWLEDINLIKDVKWYHIKKWDEAHRHLPLFTLVRLLEKGTLIPVEDPEKPESLL